VTFGPIAIVGRACILPGALTPDALWRAVLAGRDLTAHAPPGRWRVDPSRVLASHADGDDSRDRSALGHERELALRALQEIAPVQGRGDQYQHAQDADP